MTTAEDLSFIAKETGLMYSIFYRPKKCNGSISKISVYIGLYKTVSYCAYFFLAIGQQ